MTVRVYRSTDPGAPVLSGLSGSTIGVLDACLVNGYGAVPITSITQVGGVATATTASMVTWTNSPNVVISGANEAGYNVEAVLTVTGLNTFTYPVAVGTASTATGTMVVGRKGSGWTKPFSGTNLAAYKQPVGSNGMYLYVADISFVAAFVGYESMTSLAGGVNPFPLATQLPSVTLPKSNLGISDPTSRPWVLACNGKTFYLFCSQDNAISPAFGNASAFAFGDFLSEKPGDAFATIIFGGTTNAITGSGFSALVPTITASPGHFIARSHSQVGGSVTASKGSDYYRANGATVLGGGNMPFPSPVDGGAYVSPVVIGEYPACVPRGTLPGIWNSLHPRAFINGDKWVPGGDLVGKTLEAVNIYGLGQALIEISDTW